MKIGPPPGRRRPAGHQTGISAALRRFFRSFESPTPQRFWISRSAGDATKMEE